LTQTLKALEDKEFSVEELKGYLERIKIQPELMRFVDEKSAGIPAAVKSSLQQSSCGHRPDPKSLKITGRRLMRRLSSI
jgi:hypothetical protein